MGGILKSRSNEMVDVSRQDGCLQSTAWFLVGKQQKVCLPNDSLAVISQHSLLNVNKITQSFFTLYKNIIL